MSKSPAERCPSWPKEHDWKSCVPARVPRVRISSSPPCQPRVCGVFRYAFADLKTPHFQICTPNMYLWVVFSFSYTSKAELPQAFPSLTQAASSAFRVSVPASRAASCFGLPQNASRLVCEAACARITVRNDQGNKKAQSVTTALFLIYKAHPFWHALVLK